MWNPLNLSSEDSLMTASSLMGLGVSLIYQLWCSLAVFLRTVFLSLRRKLFPDPHAQIWDHLYANSRSFAFVIDQLHPDIRLEICIFYLILRALDTLEDDMSIEWADKMKELPKFYKLLDPSSVDTLFHKRVVEVREYEKPHEELLMRDIPLLVQCLQQFKPDLRDTIIETTQEMGEGMSIKLERYGNATVEEYDEYCYYVAGVVGKGLTNIFLRSGLQNSDLCESESISMGLLLQKVNIIRDVGTDLKDSCEPRVFYPVCIWSEFVDRIEDLVAKPDVGVLCVNELIIDALRHLSDCCSYLQKIENDSVFVFCALPQVMALATLALMYGNTQVLQTQVKIGRSTTMLLSQECLGGYPAYMRIVFRYLEDIQRKAGPAHHQTCTALIRTLKPFAPLK